MREFEIMRSVYLDSILESCQRKLFELIRIERKNNIVNLKCKDSILASLSLPNNIPEHISSSEIAAEAGEHFSRMILSALISNSRNENAPADVPRLEKPLKKLRNIKNER